MLLHLDIAGLTFALITPEPAWAEELVARYADFLTEGAAAWQVTLIHDPTLTPTLHPWVRHEGSISTFRVGSHSGWLDLAARQAVVAASGPESAGAGADRMLGYLCMLRAPRTHQGLLLHATGVVLDGAGYVFAGASGAGKSTVARLAAGRGEVLTDENVILLLDAAGPRVHSTPFWGLSTPPAQVHRHKQSAPLAAVFLLEQGPAFQLRPLAPAQAVMALLTTEKVAVERTDSAAAWLSVAEMLVQRVPVSQLTFRPEPALWEFLQSAVLDLSGPGRTPAPAPAATHSGACV